MSNLNEQQFKPHYDTEHGTARVSPSGYVSNVVVNYDRRGQGHGTDLMKHITDDADRFGKTLTLHARKDLHEWYGRLGFEHVTDDEGVGGPPLPRLERQPRMP